MTECAGLWAALFLVGFWAFAATMHLIDAKAEIKRKDSLPTEST